jgi:drug/metabolite transporter (DMT)-like permease
MTTPPSSHRALSYGFLAMATLIWGAAPAFIRSLGLALGPAESVAIRTLLVAVISLPLLLRFGGPAFDRADWPRLLVCSIIGSFGYYLGSIYGYARMPAGMGSIIMATSPLLIALLSALAGQERLTPATLAGLALSFGGTVLLFSGGEVPSGVSRYNIITGGLMIFAGAAAWSLYVVAGRPLIQKYGAIKYMAAASLLSVVPALPFLSANTVPTLLNLSLRNVLELLYLGVLGTVVSVSAWNYAAARLAPSTVGATLYLLPLMAIAAGALVLGEAVTARVIAAAAIVLAGVALSQWGKYRRA